jgi:hypothetical protein
MAFFTKTEIIERMAQKRAEMGSSVRADYNLALVILGSSLFEKRLKSGDDYGLHPVHVGMTNTRSLKKKIVGILHDVVEDSDWTLDDLRAVGFRAEIVNGVDAMTHRAGELYFDSVRRAGLDLIGTDKKIEDLTHNMDMSRHYGMVSPKDVERTNKYKIAHAYLVAIKKGDIRRGSRVIDFVAASPLFAGQDEALRVARKYTTLPSAPRAPETGPKP